MSLPLSILSNVQIASNVNNITTQRKIPIWLLLKVDVTVAMSLYLPNMKFLCSNLWLGGPCTDKNNHDNDDNGTRRTKHDGGGSFGITPNEPKHMSI